MLTLQDIRTLEKKAGTLTVLRSNEEYLQILIVYRINKCVWKALVNLYNDYGNYSFSHEIYNEWAQSEREKKRMICKLNYVKKCIKRMMEEKKENRLKFLLGEYVWK
jgi:hypothetical protein